MRNDSWRTLEVQLWTIKVDKFDQAQLRNIGEKLTSDRLVSECGFMCAYGGLGMLLAQMLALWIELMYSKVTSQPSESE